MNRSDLSYCRDVVGMAGSSLLALQQGSCLQHSSKHIDPMDKLIGVKPLLVMSYVRIGQWYLDGVELVLDHEVDLAG